MELVAELLETAMLICFGLSWPVNLIKNYRMRSAKAMSLPFLLLIWFGYIVGNTAKILKFINPAATNPTWYLMAIYIFNFVILTANLLVYVRNRRLDKQTVEK